MPAALTTGEATLHYYLGDRHIAVQKPGELRYVHLDHLAGSSVFTEVMTGLQTGAIRYYPFGATRSTSGTIPTEKKFTGQRLDGTGLYYYNARYYDPGLGRFISPDSVVQSLYNPQTLNRYSYVLGNPLRYTDESGHFWLELTGVAVLIGLSAGAVSALATYAQGDSSNQSVGAAFAAGFVAGFAGTFLAAGLGAVLPALGASHATVQAAQALAAAQAGGTAYTLRQALRGEDPDPLEQAKSQAVSGLASLASGAVVPHGDGAIGGLPAEKVIIRAGIEEAIKSAAKAISESQSDSEAVNSPCDSPSSSSGDFNWGDLAYDDSYDDDYGW